MPRIRIFNALEIEAFESPPVFNSAERRKFFTLPARLEKLGHSFYTPVNQVCFTLTAGYFRARHKFFGKQFRPADLSFVATRLGVNEADITPAAYHKQTVARHQQMLLDFFGFRRFDAAARDLLTQEIAGLVSAQVRPKLMLLEAIEFLIQHRVMLPGYTTLADLIGEAINYHKRRLITIICWNYLYLSQQLQEAGTEERREQLLAAIRNGSVVSWQHINLHGEYDFSDEKLRDSVGLNLPEILGFRKGKNQGGQKSKKPNGDVEL